MRVDRLFFVTASFMGILAVAFGAFGAHFLKSHLGADQLATFETGVRYQMYHTFALLAVALAYTKWPGKALLASGWLFIIGTVLFSGSLCVLSLTGMRGMGFVTPFGGLTFIAGWLCMAWSIWKE